MAEQTTGEDRHIEMRRLQPTVRHRAGSRFDRDEVEGALGIRAAPSEASRFRLPHFEQRVGDGVAVAIEHLAFDSDRARRPGRHDLLSLLEWEPNTEEWSDGLGRCDGRAHRSFSNGVAARPRSTISHR